MQHPPERRAAARAAVLESHPMSVLDSPVTDANAGLTWQRNVAYDQMSRGDYVNACTGRAAGPAGISEVEHRLLHDVVYYVARSGELEDQPLSGEVAKGRLFG